MGDDWSRADVYVSALRTELKLYGQLIDEAKARGDFDKDLLSLLDETFRDLRINTRELREQIYSLREDEEQRDAMKMLRNVVRCSFIVGSIISKKSTDPEATIDRLNRQLDVARKGKKTILRSPHLQEAVIEEAKRFWEKNPTWFCEKKINATANRIVEAVNIRTKAVCDAHGIAHQNVKGNTIRGRLKKAWPGLVEAKKLHLRQR